MSATTLTSLPGTNALRLGGLSVRYRRRTLLATGGLLLALLLAAGAALKFSQFPISWADTWLVVFGEAEPGQELVIGRIYLPRVLTGVLVGFALGMAGAVFQSLTRNPLGSPDIIGFDNGAATGALVVLLVAQGSPLQVSLGAVAGGLLTAVAVFLLAAGRGVHGFRLVLVGIGLGSLLVSVNWFLITRADVWDAQSAGVWLVGNVAGVEGGQLRLLAVAVAVLAGTILLLGRGLAMTELHDDTSRGLGVRLHQVRAAAVLLGVALAAVAVAAAGPVVFVALAAPQVARSLTRAPGPNLLAAGLTGALLLVVADHGARELFLPRQVPVGVMTGVIGGLYLTWLLTREWRRGRA